MFERESDFRRTLGKKLEARGFFFQPIESGSTADGVPDAYFVRKGWPAGWLELKRIDLINFHYDMPIDVPYRPGQFAWLKRNWNSGGLSVLGIRMNEYYAFFVNSEIKRQYTYTEIQLASMGKSDTDKWFIARVTGALERDRQKDT